MKKVIAMLLGSLILLSSIPMFVSAENDSVFLAETYEDATTHALPTLGEFTSQVAYIEETSGKNKLLRLRANEEGYIKVKYTGMTLPDEFVFSAEISVSGGKATGELSFINSSNKSVKILNIAGKNGITNPEGYLIGGFTGLKQKIDIIYNAAGGVYSIYIDGKCVCRNYYLKSAQLVKDIASVQLALYPEEGASIDVTLDNVYIYGGGVLRDKSKLPKKQYNENSIQLEEGNASVKESVYFIRDFDEITMDPFYNLYARIQAGSNATIEVREEENGNKYLKWIDDKKSNRLDVVFPVKNNYTRETAADKRFVTIQLDVMCEDLSKGGVSFNLEDTGRAHSMGLKTSISSYNIVADGTNVGRVYKDRWTNLAFVLDAASKTYNVFVDYKLVKENIAYANKDFGNPAMMQIPNSGANISFDQIAVYSGKNPKPMGHDSFETQSMIRANWADVSLLKVAEVLNTVSKRLYYGGEIAASGDDLFIEKEGSYYIDVEAVGKMYEKSVEITDDGISANGIKLTKTVAQNGKTYAVCDELFGAFGKKIYIDDRGMIIAYTGELDKMSWGVAGDYGLWDIYNYTAFDRPSAESLLAIFNEKSKGKHPRIIHSSEQVEEVKKRAAEYEEIAKMLQANLKKADAVIGSEPVEMDYSNDVSSARKLLSRITYCGEAYLFTRDSKYAEQVWSDIKYSIDNWGDWRPLANLSHSETVAAVSIGYDWCYDYFTDERRKEIEETLKERCLHNGQEVYGGLSSTGAMHYVNASMNQNPVGHGAYALGAVALMDAYPEESAEILSEALKGVEVYTYTCYPSGAYTESLTYWTYGMQYFQRMITTLDVTFGTDFGLMRGPDFAKAPYYIVQSASLTTVNNFHDGENGPPTSNMGNFGWLSEKLDDPGLMEIKLAYYNAMKLTNSDIWYTKPEHLSSKGNISLPLDAYFQKAELVSMRSDWGTENATWLSFHGGDPLPGHGHVDTGTYVFNMLGERWITETPVENYAYRTEFVELYNSKISANGRGWTAVPYLYLTRPEGHNCVVINPDFEAGQDLHNWSYVTKFESKDRGTFAVLDLSDTYHEDAKSYIRGYMLGDDRRSVQIRDEIKVKKPDSDVCSFMYVDNTDVEIVDERTAILTKNGKQIKLEFVTDGRDVKFTAGEAKPLESSPQHQKTSTESYTKLTINMKVDDSAYIHVRFLPVTDPKASEPVLDKPISEWEIPDGEVVPLPAPEALYRNGDKIESFAKDAYSIALKIPEGETVPQISADISEIYDYELKQAQNIGDVATLKLWLKTDPSIYSIYTISFEVLPKMEDIEGYARPAVYEIYSNNVPQPANGPYNLIDGDLTTRHAMESPNDSWARFDMGSEIKVDAVAMAVHSGNSRTNWFSVEVSKDGKEWTEVYKGQSSGTTAELEIYTFPTVTARYVRLVPEKSSAGSWYSTTEFYVLQSK